MIDKLRLALSNGRHFGPLACLMATESGANAEQAMVNGYSITIARDGSVSFVQAISSESERVASGYAGEVPGEFVYPPVDTVA